MNIDYLERKVVSIFKDGKKFDVHVPLDFVVTQEWLKSKITTDEKVLKCEEWLKKKGFNKDEYGRWNLVVSVPYGKKATQKMSLPKFFYNKETKDLNVALGTILGLNSLIMPIDMNLATGDNEFEFNTFKNFPWSVSQETFISYPVKADKRKGIEYEFYSFYVGFTQMQRTSNMYCTGIHHAKNYHLLLLDYMISNEPSEINKYEWPEGFIESLDESYLNRTRSAVSISKFAL